MPRFCDWHVLHAHERFHLRNRPTGRSCASTGELASLRRAMRSLSGRLWNRLAMFIGIKQPGSLHRPMRELGLADPQRRLYRSAPTGLLP